jgi:heme/copper-type cytochrome/quinol oxidase subunit 3
VKLLFKKRIGLALFLAGLIMLFFAWQHYHSFMGRVGRAVANSPPKTFYQLLMPGVVLTVIGGITFLKASVKKKRRRRKRKRAFGLSSKKRKR